MPDAGAFHKATFDMKVLILNPCLDDSWSWIQAADSFKILFDSFFSNILLAHLTLSPAPHSFPPFLLEQMQSAALLELQNCIGHRGPIRGV